MEESAAKNTLQVHEGDISILNEDTDMSTAIEVKRLPSGFKGYPAGTKITFKPITLEELEALNSSDISADRAVVMLLKSINCTTLAPEDLYYWDVVYIGIQRKLLAFGDTKGVIYKRCPKCDELVSKAFKYTELEFKEIEAPALPMKMKICGKDLEISVLTMKEFLQIQIAQGELGVYARMIKNLPFEEAYDLVRHATGLDIKKLRFADKQLDYGIKPFHVHCEGTIETNGKAQLCDEEIVLEVRSPFEVVFPEDEIDGDNEFEVQYG